MKNLIESAVGAVSGVLGRLRGRSTDAGPTEGASRGASSSRATSGSPRTVGAPKPGERGGHKSATASSSSDDSS